VADITLGYFLPGTLQAIGDMEIAQGSTFQSHCLPVAPMIAGDLIILPELKPNEIQCAKDADAANDPQQLRWLCRCHGDASIDKRRESICIA